jgi:hypothetical protein
MTGRAAQTEDEVLSEEGHLPGWSPLRIALANMFNKMACDIVLSLAVTFNLIIVIIETDDYVSNAPEKSWVTWSNRILLTFYVLECCLRLFTFRSYFFRSRINVVDFAIIAIDVIVSVLESIVGYLVPISMLRLFRLTRLRKSVSIMTMNPELSLLIRGLKDTVKTLFWGTLLIFLMLTMWSILAVQFIHPTVVNIAEETTTYDDCTRCPGAYESVMAATLTLFQILVVGDDWASNAIPIIEQKPLSAVYFVAVQVSISIGLMNLLLAVIVDRANAARTEDVKELIKYEKRQKNRMRNRLIDVFAEMDSDGNGYLTLQELRYGFETNVEFATILNAMDVEEEDLDIVYCILEGQNETGVRYDDFVEQLWKLKSQDMHTLLIFIKFYVMDVRNKIISQVGTLESRIAKDYDKIAKDYDVIKDRLVGFYKDQMMKSGDDLVLMEKGKDKAQLLQATKDGKELQTFSNGAANGAANGCSNGNVVNPVSMAPVDVKDIVDALKMCVTQEVLPLQRVAEEMS